MVQIIKKLYHLNTILVRRCVDIRRHPEGMYEYIPLKHAAFDVGVAHIHHKYHLL